MMVGRIEQKGGILCLQLVKGKICARGKKRDRIGKQDAFIFKIGKRDVFAKAL